MKETAVSLIPKEEVAFLREKEDKKFFDFITNELTREIVERLIQVLEANDEIIIKKPILRVSEFRLPNSVEYRKTVDWKPLIRCKDCKYYDHKHHYCEGIGYWFGEEDAWSDNGFCYKGERREDVSNY